MLKAASAPATTVVWWRGELAALVEQPDDRLREHCADHACRDEHERDLTKPARDRPAERIHVPTRRQTRERRKENSRDGDGEHPLGEHVNAKGLVDRRRGETRVDEARRKEGVDQRVDVDQPETERDRDHQLERLRDGRVAPVDHEPQPVVAAAQPRHRQQHLHERPREDRRRVDVELRVRTAGVRDAERQAGDDREVPRDRCQCGDAELLVAVQDPDDDPGDTEERHDRKEDAGEADGEVEVDRVERPHQERRRQHEERRQTPEPEQHQPEEARGDAPRALAVALLEQVAEHGDECRRERRVGDEGADEVRQLERDRERVDRARGPEVVGGNHLPNEPEHAREAGGERENDRRPGEPAPVSLARRGDARRAAGIHGLAPAGRRVVGHRRERLRGRAACYHRGARAAGFFTTMPNIQQQKKRVRIAAEERLENLRYTSSIKTLTKRLQSLAAEGDAAAIEAEHKGLVKLIDRAVSRGALHKNAGARKKSQAARLAAGPVAKS